MGLSSIGRQLVAAVMTGACIVAAAHSLPAQAEPRVFNCARRTPAKFSLPAR